jgi:hypothetical protein
MPTEVTHVNVQGASPEMISVDMGEPGLQWNQVSLSLSLSLSLSRSLFSLSLARSRCPSRSF